MTAAMIERSEVSPTPSFPRKREPSDFRLLPGDAGEHAKREAMALDPRVRGDDGQKQGQRQSQESSATAAMNECSEVHPLPSFPRTREPSDFLALRGDVAEHVEGEAKTLDPRLRGDDEQKERQSQESSATAAVIERSEVRLFASFPRTREPSDFRALRSGVAEHVEGEAKTLDPRVRGDDEQKQRQRHVARHVTLATTALLLAGCASIVGDVRPFAPESGSPAGPANAASPQYASAAPAPGDGGGSIFAGTAQGHDGPRMKLFEDNKARDVGDLLTIVLVENTRARTNAETAVTKDAGVEMAAPTIFGQSVTYKGQPILQAGIEGSRDFNGSGDSAQSNQLAGNITVTVVENLGNGTLRIAGEKRLRLNQGDELVQVQGIVRIADIGPDNRITSDRVGDARIVYGGRGTLARSNAMGWLGRFFNSAAFPY